MGDLRAIFLALNGVIGCSCLVPYWLLQDNTLLNAAERIIFAQLTETNNEIKGAEKIMKMCYYLKENTKAG